MTDSATTCCYRHPDRRAGVSCQRCDRPICPSCMQSASVGFHCPECARGGRQQVYTARTLGTLNRPVVTQALIAINVVAFALTNPSGPFSDIDYLLYGPFVADGEWYRLVTGGFLHANVLHLVMNMVALWFLGSLLEPAIGRLRFGVVYGASLLTGSLGVMLLSSNEPTVGASGAIFGLLGVAAAAQVARGTSLWQSGIGTLIVVNLLFTIAVPGISIGGHLGGLAGGLVCGTILYRMPKVTPNKSVPIFLCAAVGAAAFLLAIIVA